MELADIALAVQTHAKRARVIAIRSQLNAHKASCYLTAIGQKELGDTLLEDLMDWAELVDSLGRDIQNLNTEQMEYERRIQRRTD